MSRDASPSTSPAAAAAAAPDDPTTAVTKPSLVYHLTKGANIQTRHLVVYNTGPAVGVDEATLRRVFEAYGEVERVHCPNPAAARVLISFHEASSAAKAKAERNRPPEIEERVRIGVTGAATASEVFAPRPGEPCPLLGRWLKVAFADIRVRHTVGNKDDDATTAKKEPEGNEGKDRQAGERGSPPSLPAHLTGFKAFDALAEGGTSSRDTRRTPCSLCGRSCGGQRGLRMHLVGAHPLEIRDRQHFVELLRQGNASLPPMVPPPPPPNGYTADNIENDDNNSDDPDDTSSGGSIGPSLRTQKGGAAARGRAAAALPPGFAAARSGDLETLKRLVVGEDGEGGWDPKTAVDKNGSSVLDWAAGEGRVEVCRYLLHECGVDPGGACLTRGRGEGRTSLHWAARGGHEEVCRLLLETPRPVGSAATASAPGGSASASNSGARYICPDVAAAEGTTPLHWACWGAHLSTCRLLFERGADHRSVNAYGCNVAHWCGLSGDVEVCRWLARSVEEGGAGGLDWAKTNLQGHTICHKAALKGHGDLLEWLVEQTNTFVGEGRGEGVVPTCAWGKDEGGYTPRDVARLAGHVDLADWIANSGVVSSDSH